MNVETLEAILMFHFLASRRSGKNGNTGLLAIKFNVPINTYISIIATTMHLTHLCSIVMWP